jgi:ABC-2 type transport system ATP-binding protein
MTAAIKTDKLTKRYGSHPALSDLDLEVQVGEVFGYLGPNGAGKTTTIRLLLDLLRPSSGRAEILGMDTRARSVAIRRRVGYLAGDVALYERMTGGQLLRYFAELRGGVDWRHVERLVERFELDLSRPIRQLSKGNRQKVGLVQAFMHQPELLILDEPTSGLDPLVQQEFHRLLREVKAAGATVFLSSHILSEVEQVADRVAILRAGRLVVSGEISAIKAKARRWLEIHFAQPVPEEVFARLPGVHTVRTEDSRVRFEVEGSVDALVKAAARYEVTSIISHEPDLEEVFLGYYRGDAERAG